MAALFCKTIVVRPAVVLAALVFTTPLLAQTAAQNSEKTAAFYQLVTGTWAKFSNNLAISTTNTQLQIAALQCNSVKNLNLQPTTNISSISNRVSQSLSQIILYQKLATGLSRIDFATRKSFVFPTLKIGKIKTGKDGFEISNSTAKITIAFAKLKQNNRSWPIMIEGKALYLKCPVKNN